MPAPRTIITSFEDPTLLGRTAYAAGQAAGYQREVDRYDARRARDLAFLNSELNRRQQEANRDADYAMALERLRYSGGPMQGAAGSNGVMSFTRDGGGVPAGATRLQDAARAQAARRMSSASAIGRARPPLSGVAPDPIRPVEGFGAIRNRGTGQITVTADGQVLHGRESDVMHFDDAGRITPRMAAAIQGLPNRSGGGFVGPGAGGIPQQVGQQLQVLAPYAQSLAPEDFAGLEAAIRSGGIEDMNKLIDQIEDGLDRQRRLNSPGEVDPRFRTMSIREHQQEISRLERHRATMQARDVYGEFDYSGIDTVIQQHTEAINSIQNSNTQAGQTGSGGPADDGMVVVTNGTETYRIPVAALGSAQADGFREVQ